jgi:hypothetical protein
MGYCVYEMPAVRGANYQYRPSIEDLKKRLETTDPRPYHQFLPYLEALGQNWFKKRYDRFRLVAKLLPVEVGGCIVPVVVFVDFLPRADRAYGDGSAQYFEQRYAKLLQAHAPAIRERAQKHLTNQAPVFQPPPPLPEELHTLLHPLRPRERAAAFFVHEKFSRAYERLTSRSERGDIERGMIMQAVYQALQDIENAQGEPPNELLSRRCSYDGNRRVTVYYTRLQDPEQGLRHVLLLGLVDESAADQATQFRNVELAWQQAHEHLFGEFTQQEGEREHFATRYWDALSQLAERAFPSYLLAGDYELWERLWRPEHREVFLALSSEEMHTLESLLSRGQLPAVIEGRAGSGKSTLLIYYTAERLAQSSVSSVQALFLTQSEELLEKAKELIDGPDETERAQPPIVSLRERLAQEHGQRGNMKMVFQTYYGFARDQLPLGRWERFADRSHPGGWLDFAQFSDLLRGHGQAASHNFRHPFARSRDCNPETVWFILRSYIKGYKIGERGEDRWMSPDEYEEEVPAGDRQVSVELYRQVWDCVWPWYKRLTVPSRENDENPPYWDDLDLAWEVLEHRRSDAPTYAILICDEVQDLTRVELASLLAALDWTRYDLAELARQYQSLPLPIILAGDAHQTINPSCFRWQRVSADLAQALVEHLPHLQRPSITRLELAYNYRNARSIAQLCNAIQRLREHTLGSSSRLQQLWRLRDDQQNQRVRYLLLRSQPNDLQYLLNEGVLAIGPIEDDPNLQGGRDFWEAFGFLEPPANCENYVTPAEIKGLEQNHVAVVGFGVLFNQLGLSDLWNWEDGKDAASKMPISEARRFLAEFFLNRLYVACSRAREQLWIIETKGGWDSFWEPLLQWLQHHLAANDQCRFDRPNDGDLTEVIGVFKESWPDLAQGFERLAHEKHNPKHAERSAYYYQRCEKVVDASRMQAWKLYYEGKTLEAAKAMQEIDKDRASDWFWEAAAYQPEAWQELASQELQQPDWRRDTAQRYLELRNNRTAQQLKLLVDHLGSDKLHDVIRNAQSQVKSWRTWEQLLLHVLDQCLILPDVPDTVKQSAYRLGKSLCPEDATARRYKDWQEKLAQLSFALARPSPAAHNYYRLAAQHWEHAGNTAHRDYYVAKAESSNYPECLRWWESAGDYSRIITEYDRHPNVDLDTQDRTRVARAGVSEVRKGKMAAGKFQRLIEQLHVHWHHLGQPDFVRDWTNFIFDLIIASGPRERNIQSDEHDQSLEAIRGLVYGFSLASDPDAIRHRFRGSWETRVYTDSNWPDFRGFLRQIVQQALAINQQLWQAGDQLSQVRAARLAWFVLGLLWRFERRRREDRESLPTLRSELLEYIALPAEQARQTVNYLQSIDSELHQTVMLALRCVGDGPNDWVRQNENAMDRIWRDLNDCVEALAYDLAENLTRTLGAAQTAEDIAPLEWWLTVGRFAEHARFRRRALDFYENLERLAEDHNWPDSERQLIQERLRAYEERYRHWREEQTERPGREDVVYVNPGEQRNSRWLEVASLSERPLAVLRVLPDLYQVRFQPSTDPDGQPYIRHDPELTLTGPEVIERRLVYRLVYNERTITLEWDKDHRVLYVRADRTFVVSFPAAETRAG